MKLMAGPAAEIYLLDQSTWNGGEPSRRNGLVFASSRLALLLSSMAVSEASYRDPASASFLPWKQPPGPSV